MPRKGPPKVKKKGYAIGAKGADTADTDTYIEYAWQKKLLGLSLEEIAKEVQAEFDLERIPTRQTVHVWLGKHSNIKTPRITKLREDYMRQTVDRCEMLIREIMPLVVAETASIRRMVGDMEVIDEAFIKEKLESIKTVLKIEEHVRKVLGVGLSGQAEEGAVTKESVVNFVVQLIQQNINGGNKLGNAVLTGGDRSLESLDAPFLTSFETKSNA